MAAASLVAPRALINDRQFGAALIAGPVFWTALWAYQSPQPEWSWPLTAPALFLLLVVIYPVLEELVFRGALQGWLRSRNWGMNEWSRVTSANAITSVAFTLAHLIVNPVFLSVSVLIPSLIFGYFRDRYDRLHASIVLHIFYNVGYIWLFTSIPTR